MVSAVNVSANQTEGTGTLSVFQTEGTGIYGGEVICLVFDADQTDYLSPLSGTRC